MDPRLDLAQVSLEEPSRVSQMDLEEEYTLHDQIYKILPKNVDFHECHDRPRERIFREVQLVLDDPDPEAVSVTWTGGLEEG